MRSFGLRIVAIGGTLAIGLTGCQGSGTTGSSGTSAPPPHESVLTATSSSPTTEQAFVGPAVGPTCRSDGLRLQHGDEVSEATGQHTLALELVNTATTTCHLAGYPRITLRDSVGRRLPLRFRRGGDQMITSAAPVIVNLPPGATGYVTVNQYRCDVHTVQVAATIRLIPPNDTAGLTLAFGTSPYMAYCGAGDPGSVVDISPVEPTSDGTRAFG